MTAQKTAINDNYY